MYISLSLSLYIYIYICVQTYIYICSCRCALIGVPCRLRMLSIFRTFDNALKLTISPQAKRAETDPRQGTPTRAHLQPPECRHTHVTQIAVGFHVSRHVLVRTRKYHACMHACMHDACTYARRHVYTTFCTVPCYIPSRWQYHSICRGMGIHTLKVCSQTGMHAYLSGT